MNYIVGDIHAQLARRFNCVRGGRLFSSRHVGSPCAVGIHIPIFQHRSIATESSKELRYRVPHLDNVEDVENYRSGGFHPIRLGDTFKGGRYHVLHKLGYGGFSTVWLVSLKVLTADASQQPTELKMLRHLDDLARANPWRGNIIATLDNFTIDGPNGTHLCSVSRPAGPSLSAILDSAGEMAGTRRLRAPLARKLARQLAKAVSLLHDVGIVHGDITPKNVLLQLKGNDTWPTEILYQQLGSPVTDEVFTFSGQAPDSSAPAYLVEPASFSRVDIEYVSEQILLIDLGEAFPGPSPPANGVGTPVSYCSPELILERKASRASDIWALACTIFELRSGFPLFESFVGSSTEILEEMVRFLGMPPESSRSLWKEDGISISDHAKWDESALSERIREIGMYDEEPSDVTALNYHTLLEPPGMRIARDEASHLADMLRRALDYIPEKRLSAENVANHSWFVSKQ